MNANVDAYAKHVERANAEALESGRTSLARSLPCLLCRELEPLANPYFENSDSLATPYLALPQNLGRHPPIPRKIEFESAVYLKEGIIDRIFPNSPVTVLFVGDGASDKRFSRNCHRLFRTFGDRFQIFSFICNDTLIPTEGPGWDGERLFYHASQWSELAEFVDTVQPDVRTRRLLLVVDIDGTYLCPRPKYFPVVTDARMEALRRYCQGELDHELFDASNEAHNAELRRAYATAHETGFCKSYDDADLTALVGLGIYARIVDRSEELLGSDLEKSFTVPIEWLRYASFLIENSNELDYPLRQLNGIYVSCLERILDGEPTIFYGFRKAEGKVLSEWGREGRLRLNRAVASLLRESASRGAVAIGYSDRPNASLGLTSTRSTMHTTTAGVDSVVMWDLELTGE